MAHKAFGFRHKLSVIIFAWHPQTPNSWKFLRGERGLVLGEKAFFEAQLWDTPLILHRTPYKWLEAKCEGSVLLDRTTLSRLTQIKNIVCESVDHGESLEKALLDYNALQMPKISVPREVMNG